MRLPSASMIDVGRRVGRAQSERRGPLPMRRARRHWRRLAGWVLLQMPRA